jgi:hypothetical protein
MLDELVEDRRSELHGLVDVNCSPVLAEAASGRNHKVWDTNALSQLASRIRGVIEAAQIVFGRMRQKMLELILTSGYHKLQNGQHDGSGLCA